MDENKKDPRVPTGAERDQELFDAIGKGKKRKKARRWITAIVIIALIAGGLTAAVLYGQKKVKEQMGSMMTGPDEIVAYTVDTGSVNTTVTGSGLLADVDTETLTLPAGVKVDEVLVEIGQPVEEGTLLATVETSSVLSALSKLDQEIRELDGKLRSAANDAVSTYITAGVNGRVKILYAAQGDDVATCMAEHGALAVLSLDGYMSAELTAEGLSEGDKITAIRSEGKELSGLVGTVMGDRAEILVPDDGPAEGETVTLRTADGRELGQCVLTIHKPLKVTGYAGTIAGVNIAENRQVWVGNGLFTLKDTAFTANYETVLKERREKEENLVALLALRRTGGLTAPFAGTVSAVDWKDKSDPAQTAAQNTDNAGNDMYAGLTDYSGLTGGEDDANTNTNASASAETKVVTLSPDRQMNVTITVDETDILALEPDQEAQVTINSIGDVFPGRVTEVNRNASSQAGVTSYTAVVTVDKDPRMLPGMSAKVVVRIQGVENTILIPEEALHQTRDSAFVYTSYNYETREFGDPVAVIPGLSNGSMVEITEGLSQGDTVYYTQVWDPWAWSNASDGNASGGDAWVSMEASDGDSLASDGDA